MEVETYTLCALNFATNVIYLVAPDGFDCSVSDADDMASNMFIQTVQPCMRLSCNAGGPGGGRRTLYMAMGEDLGDAFPVLRFSPHPSEKSQYSDVF